MPIAALFRYCFYPSRRTARIWLLALGAVCSSSYAIELRLIGEQRVAHRAPYQETTLGGLSDLDYDARTRQWLVASDDRSDLSPARFYHVELDYDRQGFHRVRFTGVTLLRNADGKPYRSRPRAGMPPDMEALRVDPLDDTLWYASEGDKLLHMDPTVRRIGRDGTLLTDPPAPPDLRVRWLGDRGPRNNLAYEGLTFTLDGTSMWVSLEAPMLQDGPVPTPESGALTRFVQLDRAGKVLRQVAYPMDAIPAQPGKGRYADNGVSAILALDDTRLLVLERSAVQDAAGRYRNYIRLYEADMSEASNVMAVASLQAGGFTPMSKRLVLDLNTLPLSRLDNIEGLSWGPRLDNGNRSLVMVSDDNFNPSQVTQFLAFEVLP